ncbi:MAG TPA: M3 family metallopeptidase [Flavobacteriaceae bacterium]|nr:M3 family metallopeptidase [Flavobacteriaceae bacterium]
MDTDNPFFAESSLPYYAPDFSKIKTEHFRPALLEGIKQKKENIQAIAENVDQPTFENTIIALEKSGEMLDRTRSVFSALSSADTNDEIQAVSEELAPQFSDLSDGIYLNDKLFQRVKTLYENRDNLGLDSESKRLLEKYYTDFVIAGANLSDEDKAKLKEYNARLATLTTQFGKTLLAANNNGAVIFANKEDLAGLDEKRLNALENKDGEGYKVALLNTTQQPLLQSMDKRESREKLFMAGWERATGSHDTRPIVKEIVELRAKKAALLGFKNYAEWSLQETMAKNPENVRAFFAQLIPGATKRAAQESAEIQKMAKAHGVDLTVEPWDWNYYAEMVRKEKYDLDEDQLKPYFEINKVLHDGVFFAATKLYGITFKERKDIPVYHEDVQVYEVFEENGDPLGLFYTDFFARPSKRGGAWMSNFVTQSHLYEKKPVIYNVCNYPKPSAGDPALLTFDEVSTMFHEFGHALHGFFANQKYPSLSGTAVSRDFVEFPSQFNEVWALHPEVLKNYAVHYETGAQIPQELIDKIKKSGTFNQGYSLTENLASSNLDFEWHTIGADKTIDDVNAFEKEALSRTKLDVVHAVPPRYRSTYFAHIFSGGYAAGYYSYLWTEMLDHDARNWFETHGGLTRENGQRFREMVLSKGDTEPLDEVYRNWSGRNPEIGPLLKARGVK